MWSIVLTMIVSTKLNVSTEVEVVHGFLNEETCKKFGNKWLQYTDGTRYTVIQKSALCIETKL